MFVHRGTQGCLILFFDVDYLILTGYNSTLIDVFFSVLARQFDIIGN